MKDNKEEFEGVRAKVKLNYGGGIVHALQCGEWFTSIDYQDPVFIKEIARRWNSHDAMKAAQSRIKELEALVYVPGLWKCAKCNFQLIQGNLNVQSGTITARNQPGDKCPNCNSPLWRVTERDAGNQLIDDAEKASDEIKRLKETIAQAALKEGGDHE